MFKFEEARVEEPGRFDIPENSRLPPVDRIGSSMIASSSSVNGLGSVAAIAASSIFFKF